MYNKVSGGSMRSFLILAVILCVAITSMSCLPTKSTTPTTSQKDVDQDTSIAEVKRSIQSVDSAKASTANFDTLKGRVDTMEVKVNASGAGNSYDKTQLYTRAEVDSAIATAITNLKADTNQSWIKGGGGSGGGGTIDPTDGAILDSDGDLQLILERAVEEEVWIDDNINQTFRLTVKNNGTSSTYFRINCDFDCEESIAITSATLTPDYSGSGVATPATIGASTITSIPFLITSTGSSNKVYIGKSREESMFVTLKVDYATAVGKRWTWDFSIRDVE
jgi:hypothetical protein